MLSFINVYSKNCVLLIVVIFIQLKGNSQTINYSYDKSSRLVQATYSNKTSKGFAYDADGNRTGLFNNPCLPPTVVFSATPTSGPCPLSVQFSNTSTTKGNATYDWTFYIDSLGTTQKSTAKDPSITYNNAGTYAVELLITDSCGTNLLVKQGYITVTCFPNSVDKVVVGNDFSVHPNPTNNTVTIRNDRVENGNYLVSVSNISGQTVSSEFYLVEDNIFNSVVSLRNQVAGMYFIKIQSPKNCWTFKVNKL